MIERRAKNGRAARRRASRDYVLVLFMLLTPVVLLLLLAPPDEPAAPASTAAPPPPPRRAMPRIVYRALPQVAVLPFSRRVHRDDRQLGRRQAQVALRVAGEDVVRLEFRVL